MCRTDSFRAALRWVVLAIAAALATQASAQSWPDRPIKFIVTQAAGATPDIIARIVAEKLGQALGQQVIVENRPGATNAIGAGAAARSAPDGYTFLFATAAALVTNPYTFRSLPYDATKDFTAVATIARVPFLVVVNPNVEAKTLPELIALEKKNPGVLSVATDGPRNFTGMITSWISKLAGVTLTQVPYASMPAGIQDTLAGRVQVAILAVPSAAPYLQQNTLRAIATSSEKRIPGYDGVAPIAETFPGFDLIGWFALVAPAGTSQDIVQRVNRELDKILKAADVQERLQRFGFYSDGAGTPESTSAYIKSQYEAWGRLVKETGFQPE